MNMTNDYNLWNEFRKVWSIERVRKMTLPEYTNCGKKDTFTYWIESKLDKLGSIWGGSAFKFGIYSRNDKGQKENIGGRMYSDNYGWMRKYGETEKAAFENVKLKILETIDAVQRNELELIDQVDLGTAYKWKIAFHYQNSLDQPNCLNTFNRRMLEAASKCAPGTPVSTMQRKLISEWDGKDFLQYSKSVWEVYSKNVPSTPEQILEAEVYSEKEEPCETAASSNEHTEIQYLLLRLGNDLGFKVWVAKNDKNKQHNGDSFSAIPNIVTELPLQFDSQVNKTIKLIDVLWLNKRNSIEAAFEIESTTSIYSGLLRMSDLIAMQPNLNISLYLVAPDSRRDKVMAEINRPTFSRREPPLSEMCRFISFSKIKEELPKIKTIIKYIKPEYLYEISESCEFDNM
jgi:hypothetical protein